jgi:hypothetical protein
LGLLAYFGGRFDSDDRSVFLPGETSNGHYQIELVCEACHVESFTTAEAMQAACEACHLGALDEARDSHPESKFTDPRNADRVAMLDARFCVTCHVEHKPEMTHAMGLTIPEDYCVLCHRDIGADRPSHDGMEFATCADVGCHNFHDNRALYEDFLLRRVNEPKTLTDVRLEPRNFAEIARLLDGYPRETYPLTPIDRSVADAPADSSPEAALLDDWEATSHAQSGVNCSACHDDTETGAWSEHPGYDRCGDCHVDEVTGFRQGRHGMRQDIEHLGRELPALKVADARLPMQPGAAERSVDCGSCHGPHAFDTTTAAVAACLDCHADDHSLAYMDSPHATLWQAEIEGTAPMGSGVTCASCHMPREAKSYDYGAYIHQLVQHNQSDTMRPIERMLRPVCLDCHGYEFAVNSLADAVLIGNNFKGEPAAMTVRSQRLAIERREQIQRERDAERARREAEEESSQTTHAQGE